MFWYNPYENQLVSMRIKQKSKIYTKFMKINDIHQGFLIVISTLIKEIDQSDSSRAM